MMQWIKRCRPIGAITLLLFLLSGGCDRSPAAYYPLESGLRWFYTLHVTTMDSTEQQKLLLASTRSVDWQGTPVHARRSLDGTTLYYLENAEGIHHVASRRPNAVEPQPVETGERIILQYPLEPGTTWYADSKTVVLYRTGPPQRSEFHIIAPVRLKYTIEALDDTVAVPAGKFRDCLRVRAIGKTKYDARNYVGLTNITVEKTDWYAPGIGLIKSVREEITSSKVLNHGKMESFAGRIVMELESFTP